MDDQQPAPRPSRTLHGACLCGAVSFTASGRFAWATACHCSQCRRWHGAPGPYTSVRRDRLRFKNERGLAWYRSSDRARRGFCRDCGSSLFWEELGGETVSIALGCLEPPTGIRLQHHIFVADKGEDYDIGDGLPQWPDGNVQTA
ncbi:GFA family protein [Zavarzinia compransoris]|uniref:Aldehyde-activating protein n=1 Tax=Zavarzinia compransoris TaxID=1264899 RepID=A0A317E8K4_9PROT|nr:GFA family protein [Zavarzinia compransoris]PWR23209.1 aldehyde-activating protein [Zavarzinia compransoris]TDP46231.1 hypothetical protein DES42_104317 [Zavarzinia compransoris]